METNQMYKNPMNQTVYGHIALKDLPKLIAMQLGGKFEQTEIGCPFYETRFKLKVNATKPTDSIPFIMLMNILCSSGISTPLIFVFSDKSQPFALTS